MIKQPLYKDNPVRSTYTYSFFVAQILTHTQNSHPAPLAVTNQIIYSCPAYKMHDQERIEMKTGSNIIPLTITCQSDCCICEVPAQKEPCPKRQYSPVHIHIMGRKVLMHWDKYGNISLRKLLIIMVRQRHTH